ncbi:MAG: hypothetical protein Q7S92_00645 [Candidatus Diapherotrites archaeon]|nr:hypothetical protein [Candidatus Diapherotrites archaeon]
MQDLGIVEFLIHLIGLDIGWLFYLLLNNLPWLFAYAGIMHIFLGGKIKNTIYGTIVISIYMWTISDFVGVLGLIVFVGNLLILFYMGKFTVLTVAESSPNLKKNLLIINETQGWLTIIFFNLGIFAIFGMGF